jgi:hypothetical protein
MTDIVIIQPSTNPVTVTEDINQVIVSSTGVQGAKGDTGATGATGAQGATGAINFRTGATYVNIIASSTVTPTVNATYYTPIFIPNSITADRISIVTHSSHSGSAVVRLGIYADNSGIPSTLILDAGTVSTTAGAGVFSITISQALTAGNWYWLAWNCQTAATTNAYIGNPSGFTGGNQLNPRVSAGNFNTVISLAQSSVTGAFANAGSLTESSIGFRQGIRAS